MGAVDDSGSEHIAEIQFPASVLSVGLNRIEITATEGSYALWDAIIFEVPEGIEAGKPEPGTFLEASQKSRFLLITGKDRSNL